MGWASGLNAGSNLVNSALDGASQRRAREMLIQKDQRAMEDAEWQEMQTAYHGMMMNPSTGERRSHAELADDPAYGNLMKNMINSGKGRRILLNGREGLGLVPTRDGKQSLAVMGDDGKPKPFTLFGTRAGDPDSDKDPVIELTPEEWSAKIDKLMPYINAEQNISEGVINALSRRYLGGDETALTELSAATGVAAPTDIQNVGAGTPALGESSLAALKEQLVPLVQTAESGNDASAISPKGAGGLMQVMPPTAMDPAFGVSDIFTHADKLGISYSGKTEEEAKRLLHTGAGKAIGDEYLGAMLKEFNGNVTHTLAAYNRGPNWTKNWVANGADPAKLPQETREYIAKIQNWMSNQEPAIGDAEKGGGANPDDLYRMRDEANAAMAERERLGNLERRRTADADRIAMETARNPAAINSGQGLGNVGFNNGGVLGIGSGGFTRGIEEATGNNQGRIAMETAQKPPAPRGEQVLGDVGSNTEAALGRLRGQDDRSFGSMVGGAAAVGEAVVDDTIDAVGRIGKMIFGSMKKDIVNTGKEIKRGYTGEPTREQEEILEKAVAENTDSTPSQVREVLDAPIDATDINTATASLEGQAAAMSERGVTPAQVTAAHRRAAKEDSTRALNSALATAVAAKLMTLPQAIEMVQKTQDTGLSLKEFYDTEKARLDVIKTELEIANQHGATHLNTTEAGAQLRNQEALMGNITNGLNLGLRGQMGKVREAFGVEITDEQMLSSVLGMAAKDPVMAEILVPGLDVRSLLNGDRSVNLGTDEMYLIEQLMTHQLNYMYGGKGKERLLFPDKKADYGRLRTLAIPESMQEGSVKRADGTTIPVLDVVRSIYSNPDTPDELKRHIRGMPSAELIEYLQSHVE